MVDSRVLLIITFLGISIAAIGVQHTGALFPVLPAVTIVTLLVLIGLFPTANTQWWVASVICFGVFYRIFTFLWPPTLLGMDPDQVAVATQRIMNHGSTDAISGLYFYSKIAGMYVYTASAGLITGLDARWALIMYPLAVGIIVPLVVFIILRRLTDQSNGATIAVMVGVAIATFAGATIRFSSEPLPQVLAALLWLVFLTALVCYTTSRRWVVVLLISVLAAAGTHKLGIAVVGVGLVGIAVTETVLGNGGRSAPIAEPTLVGIVALTGAVQMLWATNYGSAVATTIVIPIIGLVDGTTAAVTTPEWTHAVLAVDGVAGILSRNGHWLVLGAVAGICWCIAAIHHFRHQHLPLVPAILGVAATFAAFIAGVVVLPISLSIDRLSLYSEPIFALVIALAVALVFQRRHNPRSTATIAVSVLVIVIVASQLFAAPATPDYPGTERFYLENSEVDAKEWAVTNGALPLHADAYYARQIIELNREDAPYETGSHVAEQSVRYNSEVETLLNRRLIEDGEYEYFADRRATVYNMGGNHHTLTWEPERTLNRNGNHARVYDNEGVTIYQNTTRAE